MKFILKFIKFTLAFIAFLYIQITETIWFFFEKISAILAKSKTVVNINEKIKHSNRIIACLLFFLPVIILLPIKLGAVYLISHGNYISGLTMYILIKILGVAIIKWIYTNTEKQIRTFKRVDQLLNHIETYKNNIKSYITHNIHIRTMHVVTYLFKKRIKFQYKRILNI